MVTDHWMGSNAPGTTIPAGDYLLWVERYYDEGGYVSGSTVTKRVTIDNTRPVLSVLTPTADERINGPVDISITASDSQTDISSASMHIYKVVEGSSDTLVTGCTSIPTTFDGTTWNATINNGGSCNLVEGTYKIAAWAYDGVLNPGWATRIQFVIDETPPSVPLNGTPDNTVIPTNNFDFNWDDPIDVSPLTYEFQSSLNPAQVNGVLTTGLWESEILTSNMIHSTGAPDGKWYWQVRAIDSVGNTSDWSEIWDVTIDTVVPTIPTNLLFETLPGDGLVCGSSTNLYDIIAKWDASIDSNIAYYEYKSFNPTTGWIWNAGNIGNVTERQGAFTVGEGIYGFAVRAVDLAGNTSDWTALDLDNSCQITYDITAPVSTFDTVLSGQFFNGDIIISGQSLDDNNVEGVELFYKLSTDTTWTSMKNMPNPNINNNPYLWSYQ